MKLFFSYRNQLNGDKLSILERKDPFPNEPRN